MYGDGFETVTGLGKRGVSYFDLLQIGFMGFVEKEVGHANSQFFRLGFLRIVCCRCSICYFGSGHVSTVKLARILWK